MEEDQYQDFVLATAIERMYSSLTLLTFHRNTLLTDNVWLEGLHIKYARKNAVVVNAGSKNAKLINMVISINKVPADVHNRAIIKTYENTSCHIIKSIFWWNQGTTVRNNGDMMIVSSIFRNNRGAALKDVSAKSFIAIFLKNN